MKNLMCKYFGHKIVIKTTQIDLDIIFKREYMHTTFCKRCGKVISIRISKDENKY